MMRSLAVGALAMSCLGVTACGGSGNYVWYTQVPRADWGSQAGEYVIGPGDVIDISVYEQPGLTGHPKVRSDGRVAITFLGEVVAAGKRPVVLAQELETRLRQYIVTPRVTVNVAESRPISVTFLGEISSKGTQTLEPPATILQALAQAGGLTEFASDNKIFVLRRIPSFQRIRFSWTTIVNNESGAALFPLRNGDVIVVE